MADTPEPDDGESYDDFMARCTDETDDEEACQMAWEDRSAKTVMHKTHAGETNGLEYVLSDESVDRMGDIIQAAGWRLTNFKRNPVALFGHNAGFPIGLWKNIKVEGGELRGHLELAPEGTSPRIDEIRRLVAAGILKAVSVGFRPLKHEPIDEKEPWKGLRFLEHELVETSLVSVPANPNALAVAKGLDISGETLALVFAKQGKENQRPVPRGSTGKQAASTAPSRKGKVMKTSENIIELQGQLNVLRDGLQQHLDALDNDDVNDEQMRKTDEFHTKIGRKQKLLEQYIESEKALGQGSTVPADPGAHEIRMPTRHVDPPGARVYPEIKRKASPGDMIWKSLVCLAKLQGDRYRKANSLDVIRDTYGEDDKVRTVFDHVIGKAATVPALTTTTGWAAELVHIEYAAFLEQLTPVSVFQRLAPRGVSFTFGTNGIISIPMRSATPTIAGSFVGEGAPIPVRQGAFQALQLTPKKMAVITTFSREISEHSDPAIESILRDAIVVDTAVAIDTVLLDTNPATTIRPAGIRNGVASLTPTAGGGFAALVGDAKALAGALYTSTLGNVRNPVWLMSPSLKLAMMLTPAANGELIFRDEVTGGSFLGWPIVESASMTPDTLFAIDAADFVSVTGNQPRFDISDQATVHMEDTTPLAIGTAGTPPVVAAPVRSFWQTDTIGIRMIMPLNWAFRRVGMIAYVGPVTWK